MKCNECPILKYEDGRWVCKAHPYVENINMYTEHESCRAQKWYPEWLRAQIDTIAENIKNLDSIMIDLYGLLQKYNRSDGYTRNVVAELAKIYGAYGFKIQRMTEDSQQLNKELERISIKQNN